jgi:TPR repeat protein
MTLIARLWCVALAVVLGCAAFADPVTAQTKRAFLVGITKYRDAGIQQLTLATQDAEDVAKDLKETGFEEKNIKIFNNPGSRESFLTEFNKFVETVKENDVVFFYFSGHGYGGRTSDGRPQNYLLFGDIKSPIEFARGQASDSERKLPQLLRARAESREVLLDYQTIEVPGHGVSETEILNRLDQKKPRVAIIVIDACRTLLSNQTKGVGRVGTTLNTGGDAPRGFMILYSAANGQGAIERFGENDRRRNSLFTSVFREFLVKPGMDMTRLAKRVRDKVSQLAQSSGYEQDPDYNDNIRNGDFYFIDPVGADRYELGDDPCVFATEDMREIRERPRRERLERHLKYFAKCPTATEANQLLDVLAHSASDTLLTGDAEGRSVNPCDKLAASEEDPARPSDVSGVRYGNIDVEPAIAACTKAVNENPRVVRYLYNLARAYQRKALQLPEGDPKRDAQRAALIRYQDAVGRGYVAALNNLAIIYDNGEGVVADPEQATKMFQQGADQGHPIAMYNLAIRYLNGKGGLQRDFTKAFDLFARASEAGNVASMVQFGVLLYCGCGTERNPVRAVEWLRRAANAGSNDAKRQLGFIYFSGGWARLEERQLQPDLTQALLWFAQAAENGDPDSQHALAYMLEAGRGVNSPQPQLSERYWRLAAYGGNVPAQVEFAERILSGRVLLKPENGPSEVVQLLKQAMTLGSSKAALRLAKIYRKGELGYEVRPEEAVKYAYRAIDLAGQGTGKTDLTDSNDPLDEVAAGILLAEMAASGEAVNEAGEPLLTQEERGRLERYYGKPDPETKQVKVRWVRIPMRCGTRDLVKYFWVWDWGRDESPTESQFRYLEAQRTPCHPIDQVTRDRRTNVREALNVLWDVVHKDPKLSFADVVAAQAENNPVEAATEEPVQSERHRRHRRRR